jgi:hypothetical protein
MEEQWKEFTDAKGYYISNLGRVKINRCRNYPNGIIKDADSGFYTDRDGYLKLSYKKNNGKCNAIFIHRLVALAFIPNPENKKIVNHIDSNRKNNAVSNLEWCTAKENVLHSFQKGNRKCCKDIPKNTKLTDYQISQINPLRHYYSLRKIADLYNISYTSIKNIVIKLKLNKDNQQPNIYSEDYHINEGSTTIPNGSTLQVNGSGNALLTNNSDEDIV